MVVILAVMGAYALNLSRSSPQYSSVTISGSASTVSPGNTPLNLVFTEASGKVHNASVTNNHYSIVLPTNQTYFVRLKFLEPPAILPGAVGNCAVGSITIPMNPGTAQQTRDWSC